MNRSRKASSSARLVVLAAAAALLALPAGTAAVGSSSTRSESAQANQSCSLSVKRTNVGSSRARKTVEINLRCNYLVLQVGFRTSIPIRKIRRVPALVGAAPGDRFGCSHGWPAGVYEPARGNSASQGKCSGILGTDARAKITVALTKAVCRPKRLRVHVATAGGIDCRGSLYPCTAVGYRSSITKKVAGC